MVSLNMGNIKTARFSGIKSVVLVYIHNSFVTFHAVIMFYGLRCKPK